MALGRSVTPFLGWPMKAPQSVEANPANAIMVVVNMQNDFCKPGGAVFDERPVREMPEIIRAIAGLCQRSRRAHVRVIHIRSLRTLQEPEFTAFGEQPYAAARTWGARIVDELTPEPGDQVVDAWYLDPFHRSRLDHVLGGEVADPVRTQAIVSGGDVGGCGFITTIGFYLRNYWAVVPVDAVYGDEEGMDFAFRGRFSADSQKNIFLSKSALIEFSLTPRRGVRGLVPGD